MNSKSQNVIVRFIDVNTESFAVHHYMKELHYSVYSDDGLVKNSDCLENGVRDNPYLVGESIAETKQNTANKIASYYGESVDGLGNTVILMPYDEHIKHDITEIAAFVQSQIVSDNQTFVVEHDFDVPVNTDLLNLGGLDMSNKQPEFGDVLENNPGNDGYGFEEHEQFVSQEKQDDHSVHIASESSEQPLFGDVLPNSPGNNGYGYEEHEQFVHGGADTNDKYISPKGKPLDFDNDKVICIMAGSERGTLTRIANDWHMNKLGDAFFDDGESMTPEHIEEVTAVYYENSIPNKSSAFINAVRAEIPDAFISTEAEYSNDLGDDVSRFETGVSLNFDGLDVNGLEM